MNRVWKILILVLIVAVIAADLVLDFRARAPGSGEAAGIQNGDLQDLPVGISVGELAPNFTGTTLDGRALRLSDLQGKTLLINVFASWCGPCLAETPHLVEVSKVSGDEVVVIGLNLQESPNAVASYQRDFQISYPLVLNQDGALTEIYRPIGLPTSWFVDPQGVIRYVHAGPMSSDLILQALQEVRQGRQPDPFASN